MPLFPIWRLWGWIPPRPPKIYVLLDKDIGAIRIAKLSQDDWSPLDDEIFAFELRQEDGEAEVVCVADDEATNADGRDYVPLYMGLADVEGGAGAWGDPCADEGEEADEAKKEKDGVSFLIFLFLFHLSLEREASYA